MIEDVLKQALEALEPDVYKAEYVVEQEIQKAITSLRQSIADLEKQEPVAWITQNGKGWLRWHRKEDAELNKNSVPLYTHPQRKPLTVEKILHLVDTHVGAPSMSYPLDNSDWINFARAIEAAHNIKE